MKTKLVGAVLATQILIAGGAVQAQVQRDLFFDWEGLMPDPNPPGYDRDYMVPTGNPRWTPMPKPGFSSSAQTGSTLSTRYSTLWNHQINNGGITAFILTHYAAPVYSVAQPDGPATRDSDDKFALRPNTVWNMTGEDSNDEWVPKLDFLFADIETNYTSSGVNRDLDRLNMQAMRDAVDANTTNPDVNSAYIGNYDYFMGEHGYDHTAVWSSDALNHQTSRDDVYDDTGMTIAQPALYPYTALRNHSTPASYVSSGWTTWKNKVHPVTGQYLGETADIRQALFWAPLERLSIAKRNLQSGHKLLPWTMVFTPSGGEYYAPVPAKNDHLALIAHYRMRGADGIMRFDAATDIDKSQDYSSGDLSKRWSTTSPHVPTDKRGEYFIPSSSWLYSYTAQQHREDIEKAWDGDLDGVGGSTTTHLTQVFEAPIRTLLNLETPKNLGGTPTRATPSQAGVWWSGVRSVNKIKVLVSNLHPSSSYNFDKQLIEYGNWVGTDNVTPTVHGHLVLDAGQNVTVGAGTHKMLSYTINNLLGNGLFDSAASSGWSFVGSTNSRQTSGAYGWMKFQGTSQALKGTVGLRTEPGAKMSVRLTASGESSPSLMVSFYVYDRNGNLVTMSNGANYFTAVTYSNIPGTTSGKTWTNYPSTGNTTFTVPNDSRIAYIKPFFSNKYGNTQATDVIYLDSVNINFAA